MVQAFFTEKDCNRCGKPLAVRTMSWFNNDTICMECSDKESEIKKSLRARGIDGAMEGCGFVPTKEGICS